jgi:type III pantothenate kinase
VDAGTAFTVDVVDASGLHRGGYIIPGLKLMRSSIEQNTAIRLDPDYSFMAESLGHSTEEAVFNGTLTALVATINMQVGFVSSELNQCGKVYFSGGDAGLLHKHAAIPESEIVPSLVFEGLAIACPYSEHTQSVSKTASNKQGD